MTITKHIAASPGNRVEFLTEELLNAFLSSNPDYTLAGTITEEIIEPEPIRQPREVALWRIKAVLSMQGLSIQVDTAIGNLPDPNRTLASLAWEYSPTIDRWSQTVAFVQQQLGLSEDQVDDIFTTAESLPI